jgi:predicted metal-dependent phosphoesterase TrpH
LGGRDLRMGWIDLHIHSTYSDGTLSPAAIVDLAKKTGVLAIALTDHDTMAGVAEALARGSEVGVEVIAGIEISAWHEDMPLHILGYGLHVDEPNLKHRLLRLQQGRLSRNTRIVANLNRLGINLTMAELEACSEHGQAGRPHLASLLVKKKVVSSEDEAFSRYLRRGGAAYAERFKYYAAEAIAMIREAGGVAVLAHPGMLDFNLVSISGLLGELQRIGLRGVEVYYPTHSASTIQKLKRLADQLGLLITGGSDFHGNNRSKAPLGGTRKSRIPSHLLEPLMMSGPHVRTGSRNAYHSGR